MEEKRDEEVFGSGSSSDPKRIAARGKRGISDSRLVVIGESEGMTLKVSTMMGLQNRGHADNAHAHPSAPVGSGFVRHKL